MSIVPSGKEQPSVPPSKKEEVYYKVSIMAYNKEKKTWEEVLTPIGYKAAMFIQEKGNLEFFKTTKAGDLIEISEQGVLKKAEGRRWVEALTTKEQKEKFPDIKTVIKVMNKQLGKENPELSEEKQPIIHIEVKSFPKAEIPSLSLSQFNELNLTNPQLGHEISENLEQLERLNQKKGTLKEDSDISKIEVQISELRKTLTKQVETAKTDVLGLQKIQDIQIQASQKPALEFLGKGKAKIVYGDAKHAYITPIKDSKKAEIQREVNIAKKIQQNVYQSNLKEVIRSAQLTDHTELITNKLLEKYPEPETLWNACNSLNKKQLAGQVGITENEAGKILQAMKNIPLEKLKGCQNLAVDLEEVKGVEQYTVETSRARGDLETEIRQGDNHFEDSIRFCSGIASGQSDLYRSSHLHRDPKLENVLVYEVPQADPSQPPKKVVKIADFGKTIEAKEHEEFMWVGNPRYSSPEGKSSFRGEVFSEAVSWIRVLEEKYLKKQETDMLVKPMEIDPSKIPDPKREGVEKFLVMNKAFNQTDSTTLRSRVSFYARSAASVSPLKIPVSSNLKAAEKEMYRYIDALTTHLKAENASPQQILSLNTLLKDMTNADPSLRPSPDEVKRRFDAIWPPENL